MDDIVIGSSACTAGLSSSPCDDFGQEKTGSTQGIQVPLTSGARTRASRRSLYKRACKNYPGMAFGQTRVGRRLTEFQRAANGFLSGGPKSRCVQWIILSGFAEFHNEQLVAIAYVPCDMGGGASGGGWIGKGSSLGGGSSISGGGGSGGGTVGGSGGAATARSSQKRACCMMKPLCCEAKETLRQSACRTLYQGTHMG